MSAQNDEDNQAGATLKPELAFDWIKYKKVQSAKKVTADDLARFVSKKKKEQKQIHETEEVEEKKSKNQPQKVEEKKTTIALQFKREDFKGDAKKERIALLCEVIAQQKELTMEELSKGLNIPDLMDLEDFLFRYPPLKYAYSWRGKNLKFSDESLEKLQELLKE